MISYTLSPVNYWILGCLLGFTSIVLLVLCMKSKKKSSITMVSYVRSEDATENSVRRSRASTNGTHSGDVQTDHRISQHSMPNENRILPDIPKGLENRNEQMNGTPLNPDQSAAGAPVAVSLDGTQHNPNSGSPKKNRRLPALPPGGSMDILTTSDNTQSNKDIDDTYEDVRDDNCGALRPPENEIVGSGDSGLYARVPDNDLDKQQEDIEDNDLYAQVGDGDTIEKEPPSMTPAGAEGASSGHVSASDDDRSIDSPAAVTYASVDKSKKTISVKRSSPPTQSYCVPPPPPIPDRNFDDDEMGSAVTADYPAPPPPVLAMDTPLTSAPPDAPGTPPTAHAVTDSSESTGPAYDTLSVRESFAHQRLRQIVEDEQRNRYVNTNQATVSGQEDNSGQPDVYAQIEDDSPEAVYESVSAPGSADGTVGVTGRPTPNNTRREDGYVTLDNIRSDVTPPNGGVTTYANNPHYEDINPR